jgi:aspartyl-tRNA(Asn)/glutamyl-tRNA(Gln) amidotransferase subunit B
MWALPDYERRRHALHYLNKPDVPLKQETRGFNEVAGTTHTLRTKEDAEDYRYMPDPNLPPVTIAQVSPIFVHLASEHGNINSLQSYLDALAKDLPELPDEARHRLSAQYGITITDAETLSNMDDINGEGIKYFEEVVSGSSPTDRSLDGKKACNWYVWPCGFSLLIR